MLKKSLCASRNLLTVFTFQKHQTVSQILDCHFPRAPPFFKRPPQMLPFGINASGPAPYKAMYWRAICASRNLFFSGSGLEKLSFQIFTGRGRGRGSSKSATSKFAIAAPKQPRWYREAPPDPTYPISPRLQRLVCHAKTPVMLRSLASASAYPTPSPQYLCPSVAFSASTHQGLARRRYRYGFV